MIQVALVANECPPPIISPFPPFSEPASPHDVGPGLGMKKSSSLESLQTMVHEVSLGRNKYKLIEMVVILPSDTNGLNA